MNTKTASEVVTRQIRVTVQPQFEPDHSEPQAQRFVFSYNVIIRNESEQSVKLLRRSWLIINGEGDREEVQGPGVVGFTPSLGPGEEFRYASYCPLDTPFGTMEGHYSFEDEQGDLFDVTIGRFYLVAESEEQAFIAPGKS